MKVHDNSCFHRGGIVLGPYADYLKPKGLVELLSSFVGRSNLQENVTLHTSQPSLDQASRHPSAAVLRRDREIEDLGFTYRECTAHEERGDFAVYQRDSQIVLEVIPRLPPCGFGAR